jgi:hypothetical protein
MGDATDDTTPPASLEEDNGLRDLVRGCTVEFRNANHVSWESVLVGDLVDEMPEPSYTTISTIPFMEVRFAGKVFRCEATDGVMTMAAMLDVLDDLLHWVLHCMSTGFQGAPANWSYAEDEGNDHEPTRATSPPPQSSDPAPPQMDDPPPETTELPDHFPRSGDVNLAR